MYAGLDSPQSFFVTTTLCSKPAPGGSVHVTLVSEVAVVLHGFPFTLITGSSPKSEPSIVNGTPPPVGRSVVSPTMLAIVGLTQGLQAVRLAFADSPALHVEHAELPAGAT